MTTPTALPEPRRLGLKNSVAVRCAVLAAGVLRRFSPARIKTLLGRLSRGSVAATSEQASTAREDVLAVSVRCAGENCLQRSLATALLCRLRGQWATWCVGVRIDPFRAHAWIEVDGVPIGEPFPPGYYRPLFTVPLVASQP